MTQTPEDAFLTAFHVVAKIGATDAGGVERQAATPRTSRPATGSSVRTTGWTTGVDGSGTCSPGAPGPAEGVRGASS